METYEPEVLSTIEIQDKNLEAVKAGMLALTTDGSVRRYFQDLPVQVGAKTGSAQVSAQTESNAVFVCFAPYDDPEDVYKRQGVACLKLEGRMKRPEYVAVVTGVYARALKEGRSPTQAELDALEQVFSRQGFTDSYFMGQKGPERCV